MLTNFFALLVGLQALKANPDGAPKEFKINSNYITKFGQVGWRLYATCSRAVCGCSEQAAKYSS